MSSFHCWCLHIFFNKFAEYLLFTRKALYQLTWRMNSWVKQNSFSQIRISLKLAINQRVETTAKIRTIKKHNVRYRDIRVWLVSLGGASTRGWDQNAFKKWHSVWALKIVDVNGWEEWGKHSRKRKYNGQRSKVGHIHSVLRLYMGEWHKKVLRS